jgi:rod shape determining protein RodA
MDWVLVMAVLGLSLVGLACIYSASFFENNFLNLKKQIVFLVFGFLVMVMVSFFDWRPLKYNSNLILALYLVSVLSLVFLLFFAPLIKGIRGWFQIGPISIDPVEPLKIVLIILLAKYFSRRHIEIYKIQHILISGLYTFVPFILVFLQPDLGSASLLLLIWLTILIASEIEIKHFAVLLLVFVLLLAISWNQFLRPYQKQRILTFVFGQSEELGTGWSQFQSRVAIGSGGLWGKGFRRGSQVQLGFLTLPQTDFVFAALAEEFGFLGVLVLLSLIFFIFLRIMSISLRSRTNFGRLFSLGFGMLLVIQSFIHIAMNLGILPVVGIPLPFVSYGGSGLVSNFIALGVLQSLRVYKE